MKWFVFTTCQFQQALSKQRDTLLSTISSWVRHDEGLEIWFLKIVLLLRATGSVTTGNLSVFDVTGSKARDEYCKRATGDARLLRCRVTNGNEVSRPWQHQFCKSSLCQAWSDERRLFYCSRYWTFQERFFPVFGAKPWFLFYL